MQNAKIAENIWKVAVNLPEAALFEGIWPVPNGVSINSYVVKGEKTALIDFSENGEGFKEEIDAQLESIGVTLDTVDYLILNHMEPDHTGMFRDLESINPNLKIYCSKKSVPLLEAFYGIKENVVTVGDGDSLDLGDGKVLEFYEIPNVHWPETIATYEKSSKTLFPCDAFGSFGKIEDGKDFDDLISDDEHLFFYDESLRYYSNIVSTFSMFVQKAIAKLSSLEIKTIAPSHGLVWRKNPEKIIERYSKFAEYAKVAENRVTVIWSSMYGNTESMLETVIQALEDKGASYSIFKIPRDHSSFVLSDCWRSKGLIIGMPTYEYRMFPPMANLIDILDRSHVKNKKVFRFGSYGWSGGAQKQFDELTAKLNWDYLEPVEFQGSPSDEDKENAYKQVCKLIDDISE